MEDTKFVEELDKSYKEYNEKYAPLNDPAYDCSHDYYVAGATFVKDTMLADEHNNYLRALADADNTRKNFIKKESDLYQYRYEPIMKEMLSIIDDIDRGMTLGEFSEGGKLIFAKLENILKQNGLSTIEVNEGDDFNSDIMEAVSTIAMDNMTNKVIACTQAGYIYNGKVIRYPKVVVGS